MIISASRGVPSLTPIPTLDPKPIPAAAPGSFRPAVFEKLKFPVFAIHFEMFHFMDDACA